MVDVILPILQTINQILTAANGITAISLLFYSLTFNLKERVARTFAQLMACVAFVYLTDILANTTQVDTEFEMWLRFQWLGIAFIPVTYLHLSDALLAATGRPSRGRRRLAIFLSYLFSGGIVLAAALTKVLGGELATVGTAGYLRPGPLFWVFTFYLLVMLAFSGLNYWRAYQRSLTRASKRRFRYLIMGSLGPLLATYPFLMVFGPLGGYFPILFWFSLNSITIAIAIMLVLMAYAVAYFGVSYPDRVVKSRLFQWILRGPVVVSTVLAVMVVLNRVAAFLEMENSRLIPVFIVATLLFLQYLITIIRHPIERWFFYGQDRDDVFRLQLLEERLLTTSDLRQFLESILNAACDITGSRSAFVAVMGESGLEHEVAVGPDDPLRGSEELPPFLMADKKREIEKLGFVFIWDHFWLIPLKGPESSGDIIGILGLRARSDEPDFNVDESEALMLLAERARIAILDRVLQREVFQSMDRLIPQIEEIQKMRVAARYYGSEAFTGPRDTLGMDADFVQLVRDALTHYWGGPRLTESPLLRLKVVRQALDEHDGNPVNALRMILRQGIDRVRPEGERRFTAEWMLYNILEMKFLEGRKVRDVAMRLAMSEADLYRKQRVALEEVTKAIADMERDATSLAQESET
jgi:MFS family permease